MRTLAIFALLPIRDCPSLGAKHSSGTIRVDPQQRKFGCRHTGPTRQQERTDGKASEQRGCNVKYPRKSESGRVQGAWSTRQQKWPGRQTSIKRGAEVSNLRFTDR